MSDSPKIAIVTGGAGFIGSHVAERLLHDGHQVRIIDNLASGRMDNIAHLIDHPHLTFVHADVAETETITPTFENADWVFHLAALADIVPSIDNPHRYHHANVNGTIGVLEATRRASQHKPIERFIYTASSSCYGIPDIYPTPENAPMRPAYPYALTKMIGEQYVMHWQQVYHLPAVSLRLFNVYGPRARTTGTYGAVFGVFLAQKLAGKPYTIVGDGTQTRDFTFVTDVADAFVAAANAPASAVTGQIFNVGSGDTYSVNQLVAQLGGPVIHIPKRPGEPDCTFADTHKINNTLGWHAPTPFEKGVDIMLEHLDDFRDAPVWDEKKIEVATQDWFKYLGPQSNPTNSSKQPVLM